MTSTEQQVEETSREKGREGRVVSVIGPVIDVEFAPEALPEINFALQVQLSEEETIIAEVAQHIGH